MSTNFPASLDTLSNPLDATAMNGGGNAALGHAKQHTDANDAIEALEATVGVTNSTDVNSIQYKLAQKANASHTHTVGQISATGTPSATTFLRGDGTWDVPAGGAAGVSSFNTRTGAVTLTSGDVTTALGYTPSSGSNALGTAVIHADSVSYVAATDGFIYGVAGGLNGGAGFVVLNGVQFQMPSWFVIPIQAGQTYYTFGDISTQPAAGQGHYWIPLQ